MKNSNAIKTGLSMGVIGSTFYLGCVLIMNIFGQEALVKLANLLFHGVDFESIIRMNIQMGETILGLLTSFIVWGFFGWLFSFIYSLISPKG